VESPSDSAVASNLVGKQLGAYEVVEMLGHGGMASVFKAFQTNLRRHVAIKVLHSSFLQEPDFRTRFQHEAETIARLEHPNILPIYDYGEQQDVLYIVMPLISSGTLRDAMATAMPLEHAIAIFRRILSALEFAHTRSPAIIHRDIKPNNILMRQPDWPLLADFGIAKILEPALRITRSGAMIGTPEYMAPEQSQGGSVDHRADIYAMGAMLFELLTGQAPFLAKTPMAVIYQHVHKPVPSVRRLNPSLAPIWDEVVRCSLAKNPENRYPSARAMDDAVQTAFRTAQRETGVVQTVGPADPHALYDSAARAFAEGDWQRVVGLCSQLLVLDPARADAVELLTQAQQALRRQASDERALRAAQLVRLAEEALAADHFAEAENYFAEALELDPTLPQAQSGRDRVAQAQSSASLYYAVRSDMAAGRWDDAAAKLDELSATAPTYRDIEELRGQVAVHSSRAEQVAEAYDRGTAALERSDWRTAITAFEQVVDSLPGYRDAAERLVAAYQAQEPSEALATAQGVLAAGRVSEAIALLEMLVRQAPEYAEARLALKEARSSMGTMFVAQPPATMITPPEPPRARPSTTARIYVANRGSGTISVVNAVDHGVIATIRVGSGPLGLAVSPDGSRVYVANRGGNRVEIVDTATNMVAGTVPVGSGPYGIAVHPDGSRVYATNRFSGTVSVVDTAACKVVATIPVGRSPAGVAVNPAGSHLYVTNHDSHSVCVCDTATNTMQGTVGLPAPAAPEGVAVSPDGRHVYVANFRSGTVAVIDSTVNRVSTTVRVGSGPYSVAVHPAGQRVYVANFDSNTVSVVNTADHTVAATVAVERWPRGMALSADGARLYVVSRASHKVQAIDTATNTVLAAVEVDEGPDGVVTA
jgi:YVTN family beta-propeller protein